MSDMLDQLKQELDERVLKDIDFRERNKAVVRNHFKSNREPSRDKKHFGIGLVLSFCFSVLFLGVAGYFIMDHLGLSKDRGLSQKNEKSNEIQEYKEHTHPQPKENDEVMTKEEVLHKLFNSVDYFETAAGEFESYYLSKSTVKYKVRNKGVVGGYEKVIDYPDPKNPISKERVSKTYYNKNHVWHLDLDSMEYVKFGIMPEKNISVVKADDIFKMDPDDILEYDTMNIFRETPPNMLAGISLYNYTFIAKYLRPENDWSIEKQNEKLLGHNTLVIAGTLDDSLVDTMQPDEKKFRIWVDKDTGIMVKHEIYSDTGELVSYLHPKSLEINKTFHENELEPDLDGFHSFRDERDRELQVIEHADTKRTEVEEVMAIQRETMPLFYEFKDPKLSPFSASIEKYRKDLHAYVVYSYDKPVNEVGSGSRLLYTRIHPKDTYLRKTGDFVRTLGEEIDSMQMNGIQWHMFKVEDTDEVFVKGESGDYMIEIVTQKVSGSELKRLLGTYKKIE
ncbi:hypothetical protein [Rossellomorea sp. KS-H15a]|uniref:hypothetical protein n=1 Tax=Rossellomorea sp. KS-H15a TaxID=2963940 RepID=UPI0020C732CB|nr:hypothetical protein [Rossellomorea sp. KS-H15a]UTE76645.1 hypothetical protein M1J35_19135 [Rossellomorea sp. KS-H15a]